MYSRGMYVGPPGGVNISRCIAASTSRAIFTRNSSQTRRGLACSSAASSRSSPVSPSIHFLIDSSRPNCRSFSARDDQSNFTYLLLIQPRSDEYGSVLGRPCSTTCTSYQLLSALNTFTLEPDSASPIGRFAAFATGRRFTSVVVTPCRPITTGSTFCATGVSGFQRVVTYLCVANSIPENASIKPKATNARRFLLAGNTESTGGLLLSERPDVTALWYWPVSSSCRACISRRASRLIGTTIRGLFCLSISDSTGPGTSKCALGGAASVNSSRGCTERSWLGLRRNVCISGETSFNGSVGGKLASAMSSQNSSTV